MIEITTKELIEEYEKIMNITLSKRERIIFLYARIVDFIMEKDVEICETRLGSAIRSFLKTGKRPDHIVINISIDETCSIETIDQITQIFAKSIEKSWQPYWVFLYRLIISGDLTLSG